MSWWAVGAAAVSVVGNAYSSNKASKAAKEAAATQAEGQANALGYQQQVEELPLAYRDAAMGQMGGEYGLTFDNNGNIVSDGSTIGQRAMSSPFYQGALQQGESAIARNASATGRLRGGATPAALGGNAQNAFMAAYQQQLQGLNAFARTPLNTNAIAGSMSGIGVTNAQGQIASAQAQQQGIQNSANAIGAGLAAYGNRPQTPPPQQSFGGIQNPNTYSGYV